MIKDSKKPKILILDKDDSNLKDTASFLIGQGYSITTSSDSFEAIKVIQNNEFDLLLLEKDMPDISGSEIMRKLQKSLSQISIIFMQSSPNYEDVISSLKGGAFDFLIKPYSFERLELSVREGLENRKSFIAILNLSNKLKVVNGKLKIQKKTLEEEKKLLLKWNKDLNLLNELNQGIVTTLSRDEIVENIVYKIGNIIPNDIFCLFLYNESKVWVSSSEEYKRSKIINEIKKETIEKYDNKYNGFSFPKGIAVRISNNKKIYSTFKNVDGKNCYELYIPLIVAGNKIGIIRIIRFSNNYFDDHEFIILSMMAHSLSLALKNAETHKKVMDLAKTDGLTNLFNKRTFFNILERQFKGMVRYKTPLSLILIDVDNFKCINDKYGHQDGDIVLKEIAGLLMKGIRDIDVACRYGGEEFTIILPETPLEQAMLVAERLKRTIKDYKFNVGDQEISVTISIGLSSCPDSEIKNMEDLISQADKALYLAKKNGRNRIETMNTYNNRLFPLESTLVLQ